MHNPNNELKVGKLYTLLVESTPLLEYANAYTSERPDKLLGMLEANTLFVVLDIITRNDGHRHLCNGAYYRVRVLLPTGTTAWIITAAEHIHTRIKQVNKEEEEQ